MAGDHRLDPRDERVTAFFRERHLATLTTLRADGTPHVVPVGVTFDAAAGLARVITSVRVVIEIAVTCLLGSLPTADLSGTA